MPRGLRVANRSCERLSHRAGIGHGPAAPGTGNIAELVELSCSILGLTSQCAEVNLKYCVLLHRGAAQARKEGSTLQRFVFRFQPR